MDDAGTSGRSLTLRADHVEDVLNDMRGLVTGVQALLEAPIMRGRHLFTSGGQRYAKEISIQVRYESYTPFNNTPSCKEKALYEAARWHAKAVQILRLCTTVGIDDVIAFRS